jgi:hypothetical protein
MSTLHKRFNRKHPNGVKKSHSSIFLDLSDQSYALYYLGLTYHLKAKELLCSNGGVLDDQIRFLLNKSRVYYE